MDRRTYVRAVAALGGVGVAGCSGSPTDTEPGTGTDGTPTRSEGGTATDETTESPTGTGTPTPTESATDTPTPTPRPEVAAEVAVGPDARFRFDPDSVEVAVGETVRWVWASRGHNVKPEDIPAESDWTGTAGDRGTTYRSGHVHTHAFEVAGTYDYVCVPHRTSGMVGTVVVG